MSGTRTTESSAVRMRATLAAAAITLSLAAAAPLHAQVRDPALLLKIDLLEMSGRMETRYKWAETGALSSEFILLGAVDGPNFLYPNFIPVPKPAPRTYIEYDPVSRQIYRFSMPGHERFVRREGRDGVYFVQTPRRVDLEGMAISIQPVDVRSSQLWRAGLREAWVHDVRYAMEARKSTGTGRGGLIDINIPISLPKQLEAIFGRGEETRLTVSGREKITIGGTSRWCANCPRTEGMPQQQKFPDLDMEQQLSVNLHGTIGEKINVAIDHSSVGGGAPSTNRVRLNYTGFDDEIIKLIEMGDTDLTLTGAQLISFSGQAKGLFGVKAIAQIGPLDLTVIASKEEGETSSGTFTSSGGQASESAISDYNYIKRQFFYLETPGESFLAPTAGFGTYYPVVGGEDGDSLQVYASMRVDLEWNSINRPKVFIKAYTDPNNDGDLSDGNLYEQWFYVLIEGKDYDLIQDYGAEGDSPRYLGIRLRQPLGVEKALAVSYKLDKGAGGIVTVGDYPLDEDFPEIPITPPPVPEEYLVAELICPPEEDFDPPSQEGAKYSSTWNMMFRNVYSLGLSGIEDATLSVSIRSVGTVIGSAEIDEYSKEQYLRIFGLDRYETTGDWGPDGFVDVRQGVINFYDGYIMFPNPQPFDISWGELMLLFSEAGPPYFSVSDSVRTFVDSLDVHLTRNGAIYNEILDRNSPPHYYDIVVEASSGSRVFNLGSFDILEGTDVVTVDGVRLDRGTDYDIDYMGGVVTLKGDYGNLPPDARVTIDYQHTPLFGGGTSSLLGIGSNLYLSENSRLNATFLYNSVGAPKYKPRIGEEPTRNMAADINGSFQFKTGWLTSIANLLPRVDTDAVSTVNLAGEVAMSFPNPNTKGEAFIDDMEGVEDSDQINVIRSQWYEASPPLDPYDSYTLLPPWPDSTEVFWYNPANTDLQQFLTTSKKDLNPKLDDRENSRQTSLFIKAYNPGYDQWAGVMTGFPGGIDLSTAQYLEIWVNDYTPEQEDRAGVLHIDFGKIDEDFHQPELNSFDVENLINWTIEDDYGFAGDDKTRRFNGDFSDDKWDPERRIYKWIDSRIGNAKPDSEDLNRNSRLDTLNEYYSVHLDLADTAIIDVQRDFKDVTSYWNDPEKGWINEQKSWRMYRLDLSRADVLGGLPPRLDKISHMRIWVENIDEVQAVTETDKSAESMIEITGVKFVGSRWEWNNIRDLSDGEAPVAPPGQGTDYEMKVNLGTINNKDNPSIYESPYPVDVEEGIENKEQSLLFTIENFETGYSFKTMKRFFGQGSDFQQYREIQFFVRPGSQLVNGITDGMEFYLQIAYDSLNYYEVAVPLDQAMADEWQVVDVMLSDLTNIKIDAPPGQTVEREISDSADPSKRYMAKLVGNPTLFKVRYLFAGIRNDTGIRIPEGSLWFNDIGLGSVRKDVDHAERMSAAVNLANIASVNIGYQHTGPEFRSLKQKSGSGVTNDSYNINGKTEINHFIPTLGFTLPVTARYSKSQSKPKYMTQSDVEIVDEQVSNSLKTIKNSYTYTLSLSRRNSRNVFMRSFFDNLKAGVNYSKSNLSSPTSLDTSWSYSWNTNYQVQFSRDRKISLPTGIKMRYWLSNFSIKASGSKSVRGSYSLSGGRYVKNPVGVTNGWDDEISMSYDPFESMKFNYRRTEKRNLLYYREFLGMPVGKLLDFRQNFEMQYTPRGNIWLISQFNPRLEYTARYVEDLNPSVRSAGDPPDTRNVTSDRNINLVFDLDVGGWAYALGKLTGLLGKEEKITLLPSSPGASLQSKKDEFKKMMEDRLMPKEHDTGPPGQPKKIGDLAGPQAQSALPADTSSAVSEKEKEGRYSDLLTRRPSQSLDLRPPVQAVTEADTMPSEKVEEEGEKGSDPWLAVKQAIRFIGKIKPIKSTLRFEDRSSYQRLYERASWLYQLGLVRDSGAIGSSCDTMPCPTEDEPNRASNRINLDLRSGIDLTKHISADVRFNILQRTDEADSRLTETQDMTWPDVSVNWKGLENWSLLKNYIQTSNFTINYLRKTSKSANADRENYAISPNWSLTWKNSLSTNLSFAYSKQTMIQKKQEMWDKTWSTNLELRYDIRGSKGFGLPIPGLSGKKLKFESTLTTILTLSYTSIESYNVPPATVMSVAPRFSYSFSRNISGGLTASYKRTAGGRFGYINHEVGLHASAEFKF